MSVTKFKLHCIAIWRIYEISDSKIFAYVSIFAKPIHHLKKLMLLILLVFKGRSN